MVTDRYSSVIASTQHNVRPAHSKHTASPLQRPTTYRCLRFTVGNKRNKKYNAWGKVRSVTLGRYTVLA